MGEIKVKAFHNDGIYELAEDIERFIINYNIVEVINVSLSTGITNSKSALLIYKTN